MVKHGADVIQGRAVSSFIIPLLCLGGLGGGSSATVERVTCGRSTMGKPPISQTLTIDSFGDEKTRPS